LRLIYLNVAQLSDNKLTKNSFSPSIKAWQYIGDRPTGSALPFLYGIEFYSLRKKAHQAHNLKVVDSNPAPATKD